MQEWKYWCDTEAPEEEDIPCGYQVKIFKTFFPQYFLFIYALNPQMSLDVFRKLLLIRAWCPDRTLSQARKYIFDSLGAEYLETTVLDLEAMLEESDNRVPLICLLSTGSDPR